MIVVNWTNAASGYSVDRFSPSLFADEGEYVVRHETSWDGVASAPAVASATVVGKVVELDYGGIHRAENERHEISPDRIKLRFVDEHRTTLVAVEWYVKGGYCPAPVSFSDLLTEFDEGDRKLVQHFRRERDQRLRQLKLKSIENVICEICESNLAEYGEAAPSFEVHHKISLSAGPRRVTIQDLAILCPNCHRSIHKRADIGDIAGAKAEYRRRRASD